MGSKGVGDGVLVGVETHRLGGTVFDIREFWFTTAHELGHWVCLNHTTEANGRVHDPIADTPECPPTQDLDQDGFVSAQECSDFDGDYLMFGLGRVPSSAPNKASFFKPVLWRAMPPSSPRGKTPVPRFNLARALTIC